MIVCKFGGSSVASKELAYKIKEIVSSNNNRRFIVVSAIGKTSDDNYKVTDKLYEIYSDIICGKDALQKIDMVFDRYEKLSKELNVKVDWKNQKQELYKAINSNKFSKSYPFLFIHNYPIN